MLHGVSDVVLRRRGVCRCRYGPPGPDLRSPAPGSVRGRWSVAESLRKPRLCLSRALHQRVLYGLALLPVNTVGYFVMAAASGSEHNIVTSHYTEAAVCKFVGKLVTLYWVLHGKFAAH